jgi:ATP-binding cassette subfamily B protein
MIAHKLSTIIHADQIIVMDEGRITQKGTHQSLLEEDGLYKELWNKQQKAMKWQIGK